MYKVYCDNYLLYHSNLENLKIIDPSLELELNKTGSFDFGIYPDHPYFGMIKKLKSIITVFQGDYQLFRGRVLDDEVGWHNQKAIVCEGDMAFLLDSVLRPFSFTGTAAEFLAYVLTLHNAQVDANKRFQVGNVTVVGSVSYDAEEYLSAKETLEKQLLEPFGGYMMTRTVGSVTYIDYLADITLLSPQKIRFGKNLLDLKRIRKGADIATVIIPLGAMTKDSEGNDTGKRLTIESVNDGADFLQDADAIAQFGTIVKSVIFDEITDPTELKRMGEAQLADSVKLWETIELSAADLATVDKDITSFHLGTMVDVESIPHGIEQRFLVSKLSLKLLDPAANKLVLGKTISTFSESVVFKKGDPGKPGNPGRDGQNGKDGQDGKDAAIQSLTAPSDTSFLWLDIGLDPPLLKRYDPESATWKVVNDTTEIVYNLEQNFTSDITQTEQNIQAKVAETVYLKDQTDAIVSEVAAVWEQSAKGFEMQFTQFNQDIASLVSGTDAEFDEIKKFIRFIDGNILLGEVGNELELQISNDRISFLQDGAEVAYFSNRKLYVTDAEILHSLQLGKFAFMPRANGNLSFKKI